MPSTFTTNTGIEKIADGEKTGLWGQTTNLNFDIVDRALNGAGTITLSGTTHTLTTTNGVLSDGQFAALVFGGAPSGANTVTIAPNTAQKLYWVRNTTAEDVVLSQGSGANVTVPPGATKAVYADGAGAGAAVVDLTAALTGSFVGPLTGNVTGNASTATALQTARTIGGVSFDGTANINLPGVNQAGNQNTTGSAARLTTARTIGGVSFDGTANINLPGVNQAGNQNTTGSAASLTTPRTLTVGGTGKTFNGAADVSWTLAEINAQLAALAALATNGIIARTGANTVAARTLAAGANITITNGDGVGGNPTIAAVVPAPTTAQVGAATAGLAVGAVGTYAFMHHLSNAGVRNPGATEAGSNLRYSNDGGNGAEAGNSLSFFGTGTWRLMGVNGYRNTSAGGFGGPHQTSIWLRIA